MKRILVILTLLSAFILPLQTAQANSFNTSDNLFGQVQNITGQNAVNWFGYMPNFNDYFDIAVLYSSQDGSDPFAGAGVHAHGFDMLKGVLPQDFFGNSAHEVVSSSGGMVAYEYNGTTIELPGGTIFVSTSIDDVNYIFAMSLSSNAFFGAPAPAAVLLLGTGLAGIVAMRRKVR